MKLWQFAIAYLILHAIICLVIFLLIKTHIFKVSKQVMPIALFVPFFGVIMILCADHITRNQTNGLKQIQLYKFSFDDNDYRKMHIYQDNASSSVVPLEEAILINNPTVKRKFMIDIISAGSDEYISLLQKARFNDDLEVAHYASTAIMEIQREYELQIQHASVACLNESNDVSNYEKLADATKQYIESGLIADSVLKIQRKRYSEILNEIYKQYGELPPVKYFCDMIDNKIDLGEFDNTLGLIDRALHLWHDNEQLWQLKMKYFYSSDDGEQLQNTITEMKQAHIFLSQETRESLAFWTKQKEA